MTDTGKTPQRPRTARPDPAPDTFAARLRATLARLNLDEPRAAEYLGVPVFTLRKWATGERQPGAAVARLLDVLGMVEAMVPGLHAALIPKSVATSDKERVSQKRPGTSARRKIVASPDNLHTYVAGSGADDKEAA